MGGEINPLLGPSPRACSGKQKVKSTSIAKGEPHMSLILEAFGSTRHPYVGTGVAGDIQVGNNSVVLLTVNVLLGRTRKEPTQLQS